MEHHCFEHIAPSVYPPLLLSTILVRLLWRDLLLREVCGYIELQES